MNTEDAWRMMRRLSSAHWEQKRSSKFWNHIDSECILALSKAHESLVRPDTMGVAYKGEKDFVYDSIKLGSSSKKETPDELF
ncbi:hypothetical protein Zmor_026040 [Zophobas morio]|mgnify:CR=1 FL=1|uniref:Uncharacterized protein n=1 Tax=Zophobas morio TaxID=2755281 RepID=A0AA38HTU6_9CUCU|nr:hypothetical protein Zmor_026040 [Zophobas morio]